MSDQEASERGPVVIHIDRREYRAPSDDMTGAKIRQLVNPPIGPDRDLWLEVPGGTDEKIGNDQVVELRPGMQLFTAPATITPGLDAIAN